MGVSPFDVPEKSEVALLWAFIEAWDKQQTFLKGQHTRGAQDTLRHRDLQRRLEMARFALNKGER